MDLTFLPTKTFQPMAHCSDSVSANRRTVNMGRVTDDRRITVRKLNFILTGVFSFAMVLSVIPAAHGLHMMDRGGDDNPLVWIYFFGSATFPMLAIGAITLSWSLYAMNKLTASVVIYAAPLLLGIVCAMAAVGMQFL